MKNLGSFSPNAWQFDHLSRQHKYILCAISKFLIFFQINKGNIEKHAVQNDSNEISQCFVHFFSIMLHVRKSVRLLSRQTIRTHPKIKLIQSLLDVIMIPDDDMCYNYRGIV